MTSAQLRAILDAIESSPHPWSDPPIDPIEIAVADEIEARGYNGIQDAITRHTVGSPEPDRAATPSRQPVGKVYPDGTLILRFGAGEARSATRGYELSTSASSSPLIRSEQTGRFWSVGWEELIDLARAAGIDEPPAE